MELLALFVFFEIAAMFAGFLLGKAVGERDKGVNGDDSDTRLYIFSRDRRRRGDHGHDMEDE